MRRFGVLLAGIAVLVASVAVASSRGATQAQPRWVVTDLGTLGGPVSWALAVNDPGQVVGWADTRTKNQRRPFLWTNGKMRDLGSFVLVDSNAAINNRGQILGRHALWQNGKVTKLGTLGGDTTMAQDINERSQIVGWSYPRGKSNHAFLWQNGKMRDLGTLGGYASDATAINERGQVVGSAVTKAHDEFGANLSHAFLWQNGKMRDLGTLGGPESQATDINDRGQVVGVSDTKLKSKTGFPIKHAFLWQNGKMTDLGSGTYPIAINERGQVLLGSSFPSFLWQNGKLRKVGGDAWAINDAGQVVGDADTTRPLISHAFVWLGGKTTDLGVLRARDRHSRAVSINARGQIVGESALCDPYEPRATASCRPHAVLWQLSG